MPLIAKVQKLETANYMGRVGQPIYPANSNGAPEKHIPQVSIQGNDVEISANHVMSDEHYIQFIWLKDVKTNEVVLAKELTPQEEKPVLKAKVPSGVELRPYLFCNLHGLWKGEPFTVSA
jgi:superoxide reductase